MSVVYVIQASMFHKQIYGNSKTSGLNFSGAVNEYPKFWYIIKIVGKKDIPFRKKAVLLCLSACLANSCVGQGANFLSVRWPHQYSWGSATWLATEWGKCCVISLRLKAFAGQSGSTFRYEYSWDFPGHPAKNNCCSMFITAQLMPSTECPLHIP